MTLPPEHWVLCGGVSHPKAPKDAVRLVAGGDRRNLTVDIAGIVEALTGRLTPEFKDLVLIASYVLAADSALTRGDARDPDLNRKWRRRIHLVIGVESLAFWSKPEVRELLEKTVGRLSDDDYTFDFMAAGISVPEQLSFSKHDGSPMLEWDHIDEVALFSGGLDSLSGAAKLILEEKKNVILVSHRSASKTWKLQRGLVTRLQELSHRRGPDHVGIRVVKHDKRLRPEHSQRSRSFLYAALAGAVAHLVGRQRVLLFENGVVALNLPVSPQIVGAAATRTAHPKVLRGFSRILEIVSGHRLVVENEFALRTRAEVLTHIVKSGVTALIRESVSCAHVSARFSGRPHCGKCSQCIDRRFGILAAGLEAHDPEGGYEIGLERGEWSEEDRLLVLEYVASADRYADSTSTEDFLARCGEANRAIPALMDDLGVDADGAGRAIYELHKRHGDEVARALSGVFAKYAKEIRTGRLPPTSLPMLLFSMGLREADGGVPPPALLNPVLSQGGEYQFRRDGEMWVLRYRGGKAFPMKPQKGLHYVRLLLERPGTMFTAFALQDLLEGKPPSTGTVSTTVARDEKSFAAAANGRVMLSDRPLFSPLGVDQATIDSVRNEVKKLQEEIEEAKEFSDDSTVERCEKQLEQLGAYLRSSCGPGGKTRREGPEQKRARVAVSNAIVRALKGIRSQSTPLAAHLEECLDRGFFLRYRDTGVPWEL